MATFSNKLALLLLVAAAAIAAKPAAAFLLPSSATPPIYIPSFLKPICSKLSLCLPTSADYDNLDSEAPPVAQSQWPTCNGPFVLCSVANCTILPKTGNPLIPLQAACGCLSPTRDPEAFGASLVTPNIIKEKSTYDETLAKCFKGSFDNPNSCTAANSAPVCKKINARAMYDGTWPLISTFTAYSDQGAQPCTGKADGSSITADCMTAACYKQKAFDGSPYTCFCPVVNVPAGQSYALGYPRSKFPNGISCDQPKGYAISGA